MLIHFPLNLKQFPEYFSLQFVLAIYALKTIWQISQLYMTGI